MKRDQEALKSIYLGQQGFFTRQQALKCGYSSTAIDYNIAKGNWEKEVAGVYSIRSPFAEVARDDLIIACLWGQNKKGEPELIISHDTALEYHKMGDIQSYGTHITLKKGCRRKAEDLAEYIVHKNGFNGSDYSDEEGFLITTPIKTLIDILDEKTYSEEIIDGAIINLFREHLTNEDEIAKLQISKKSKTNLFVTFRDFSGKTGTDYSVSEAEFVFIQSKVKQAMEAVKKINPITLRRPSEEVSAMGMG